MLTGGAFTCFDEVNRLRLRLEVSRADYSVHCIGYRPNSRSPTVVRTTLVSLNVMLKILGSLYTILCIIGAMLKCMPPLLRRALC